MISIFNLKKLSGLLRDFYAITNIRITVFNENLQELISYPEHIPPFCQLIRSCSEGLDACAQCDREACRIAAKKQNTHIYQCHAGLTEAVTPLYVDDMVVGYLLFGHVFDYPSVEEGWETVKACCRAFPLDFMKLEQACKARPLISRSYVRSATHILHAVASYLILEQMVTLREDRLAVRLNAYINTHYTEPLKAEDLYQKLGIGKTQLYEISRQLYGTGVAAQIRKLRIERAKALLEDERHIPLAEIATDCGFTDYNYFITVFSREAGITPEKYRKSFSKENDG